MPPGDASTEAAPDADSSAPAPSLLVGGTNLHVIGETSDGYIVYWGPSAAGSSMWGIFAVLLGGGAPVQVGGPYLGYFGDRVIGPDVFAWDLGSDSTNSVGPLSVWSRASGAHALAASSVNGNVAASADGSQIVFSANVTASSKDVAFARNDGTGGVTLIPGIYRDSCDYFTVFAGSAFVVQHCDDPLPDGGAVGSIPPTLTLFPSPSPDAGVELATVPPEGDFWSVDTSGASSTPLRIRPHRPRRYSPCPAARRRPSIRRAPSRVNS